MIVDGTCNYKVVETGKRKGLRNAEELSRVECWLETDDNEEGNE